MCTVSWLHTSGGFWLFASRDEKRTRAVARPPRIAVTNGIRYVAPVDPDFGGSWIAANEIGMALCLLNGRVRKPGAQPFTSRGLLIPSLIDAISLRALERRLRATALTPYLPFTLLALMGPAGAIADWNGESLRIKPAGESPGILASSSFDFDGVEWRRRAQHARICARRSAGPEALERLHCSHEDGPSAYSACMHRPDAATVSLSRIRAESGGIEFEYRAGSPCERAAAVCTTLGMRSDQ